MRSSMVIALAVLLAVGAWLASGQFGGAVAPPPKNAAAPAEPPLAQVRVRAIEATPKTAEVVVQGATRASRTVTLRSETTGRVAEIAVAEGAPVVAGQPILRLEKDDREAHLAEARAAVERRALQFEAASSLAAKEYASRVRLAEAQAELDEARAHMAEIRLDIERTTIRAPFAGVLATRPVQLGDVLQPGGMAGTIVDLDPLLVAADVSERDVMALSPGAEATARLVTGQTLAGKVAYVSPTARAGTRTFEVWIEAANPLGIPSGVTAELRLPALVTPAHLVSPAVLALDDAGRVGVKTVDAEGVVAFAPVQVIGHGPEGLWLAGLPPTATLITVGQDWVKAGQTVRPVPEDQVK
ncbi:MAG: efflux RND transporter periplasmic adaptor subunit [Alphaproteobacteria bacterium]|nr:efflux RND transporter periplasmic adaptor subunit [Alphaproteobacteria bacterium]